MRYLPDDNLSYPVLLETPTGSGSGFYFRTDKLLFLVTAKHVIYHTEDDASTLRSNTLKLTSYDKDLNITTPIEYSVDLTTVRIRKDTSNDLVLIELANISLKDNKIQWINGVKKDSMENNSQIVVVPPANLKTFNNVLISNEVFILGYPNSLGLPNTTNNQIDPKRPLLRKGIVAGKNILNNTIILDCPVYFGNSGGIAIEIEEENVTNKTCRVIGVVSQFVPFVEILKSQLGYVNRNIENSGYSVVVPIDAILNLAQD